MTRPGEFVFARDHVYFMPGNFGEWASEGGLAYEQARNLAVQFVTDPVACAPFLPAGFTVADPALVTVIHSEYHGVAILDGGGYNVVSVSLAATFTEGEQAVDGQFLLVVWENHFLPVMTGREILGWPKLLADVPDPWVRGGQRGFRVCESGSVLLEAQTQGFEPADAAALAGLQAHANSMTLLVWKHIPASSGHLVDVSYPAMQRNRVTLDRAWIGQGRVEFHPATRRAAPVSYAVANALARLPVVAPVGAALTEGSAELGLAAPLR